MLANVPPSRNTQLIKCSLWHLALLTHQLIGCLCYYCIKNTRLVSLATPKIVDPTFERLVWDTILTSALLNCCTDTSLYSIYNYVVTQLQLVMGERTKYNIFKEENFAPPTSIKESVLARDSWDTIQYCLVTRFSQFKNGRLSVSSLNLI